MNPTNFRQQADLEKVRVIINSEQRMGEYACVKDLVFFPEASELFNGQKIRNVHFENCFFNNVNFGYSKILSSKFINCEFKNLNFSNSYLSYVKFESCKTEASKFSGSEINNCLFLSNKNSNSNFIDCEINSTSFICENINGSNFKGSKFIDSDFRGSNATHCCFSDTIFNNSIFNSTNLMSVDFSNSVGLLNPIEFLENNFEWEDNCLIVYKKFNEYYSPNKNWIIEKDSIIKEEVNYDRTLECACGVNAGNKEYVEEISSRAWKCKVLPEWLPGVVVPYDSMGNIRVSTLQLIEEINL